MKKFIAFEGHNGVGKSTIAQKLAKRINGKYIYGVDTDSLEKGLKEKFIKDAFWYASALHFLAGCMECKRKIEQDNFNNIYIVDRSFWSTVAAHGDKKPEDREMLIKIINYKKEFFIVPNIIFLLGASYDECNIRINSKKNIEERKLDSLVNLEYYNLETNFYDWLINNKDNKTKIIFIDTNAKNIDEILDICVCELKNNNII